MADDSVERGEERIEERDGGRGAQGRPMADVAAGRGGFRSQSPWLKVVLVLSLAFIVLGVYRCSVEMTPAEGPVVISVQRVTVDVPEGLIAVPADSLSALATRFFVRSLTEASTAEVVVGDDERSWADVRLVVRPGDDGELELMGIAASTVGGRRMAYVSASNEPAMLREIAREAAQRMAEMLSLEETEGMEGP